MGMSIDDAIKRINNIMFTKFTTLKDEDAFLTAIETMKKYQMIVPALVNYDLLNPIANVKTIDGEGIYINLSDLQDYIYKVVENGNVD